MQLSNAPSKLVLPFANAGGKNTIPAASQIGITAGAASLTDGFPPLTRTPIAAGGVPPSGLDMNGILYAISAIARWANAGGGFAYDATFANDPNVGGYPKGARVLRADGAGYWLNLVDGNTTNPDTSGSTSWVPDMTNGIAAVTMTNANVTLQPAQYGLPVISITGTLTANLNLVFPAIVGEWIVINNTTGNFTITCKTPAGSGATAAQGAGPLVFIGDGTNLIGNLATESAQGTAKVATQAQTNAGTDDATIVTPKKLRAGFAISLGANGYIALPSWLGGFIFQWGCGTATSVPANISMAINAFTWPLAFPNACRGGLAAPDIMQFGVSINGYSVNSLTMAGTNFATSTSQTVTPIIIGWGY